MTSTSEGPTSLPAPPHRRRWAAPTLYAVIFLSGVIVGGGLILLVNTKPWPPQPKTFEQRRDLLTKRIAGKLSLSKKQTKKLQEIVSQSLKRFEDIRVKHQPEMEANARLLDRQVTEILTDKQKPKWRRLFAQLYTQWFQKPVPAADSQPATTGPSSAPASGQPPAGRPK